MFETLSLTRIGDADEALRGPIRALIAQTMADMPIDRRARSWMGFDAAFSRKLAAAGFVGLTVPERYGGHGRGAFARFVVTEELLAAGAPVAAHWIADRQSAALILRYGTEEQRQYYLPRICRGDIFFCIGMSEPGAGSDLAGVRTRAEPTQAGWRLNGQKIWTTHASNDDFMIALVRTSGTPADRHAGLSQMIIDLTSPGITIRPIPDLNGESDFAEVFFDDVDLPPTALVGEAGGGWKQVTAELGYERSGAERIYSSFVLVEAWIRHITRLGHRNGAPAALAGRLIAEFATLRELSIAVNGLLEKGESPVTEAALVKDLGTSFEQSIPILIGDDLCSRPDEPIDPELYRTLAYLTHAAPSFSLRGGTREIMRGIIARGLGIR